MSCEGHSVIARLKCRQIPAAALTLFQPPWGKQFALLREEAVLALGVNQEKYFEVVSLKLHIHLNSEERLIHNFSLEALADQCMDLSGHTCRGGFGTIQLGWDIRVKCPLFSVNN
jgi:hypothetical protein